MSLAPAGWYADPSNPAQQRYWDGSQWTGHIAAAASPAPPLAPPAPPLAPVAASAPPGYYPVEPAKKKLGGGAIAAIVIGSVVLLGILVVVLLAAIAVPVFNSQNTQAQDAAAKADVSTLGKEIATYWVDGNGPLTIYVEDGEYVIDDLDGNVVRVPMSPGMVQGMYWADNSTDWCVSVTATGGDIQDFRYSARYGLEAGTCE